MWFDANIIGFNNQENHMRAFRGDNISWVIVPSNNQVYYISSDGNVYNPRIYANPGSGFGANIVSNTYSNGIGVITFDGPVTRIGLATFMNDSSTPTYVKDVFMPESVTEVNSEAYSTSGLQMVHFTKNVSSINASCLDNVSLNLVSVDPGNSTYSIVNNSLVETSTGKLIIGTNNSYYSSDITEIGYCAFSGRINLTSMTIPNGQIELSNFTFYNCRRLGNIVIPSSITTIGREVFFNCRSFTSITIPSSVTYIGYYAFTGCSNLTEIIVNATTPPTLAAYDPDNGGVFGIVGSVQGRQIKVPANLVNTYKNAAGWSDYASEIVSQ